MTKQTDIAIAGGGIAGLTLAILLGKAGMDVHVIDSHKPAKLSKTPITGRTTALFGSSVDIIRQTGIWDAIEKNACPLEILRIVDGDVRSDFEAADAGREQFGFNVPNGTLRAALFEKTQSFKNITIDCPGSFKEYRTEGPRVFVKTDQTEIDCALLIGADGRNSAVRQQAGIKTIQKPYDQTAMAFIVKHSKAHQNTSSEFHYGGGPLAFVPMPGNQSAVVWVEKETRADELQRLKKQDFEAALQRASQNILGAINLETTPESYPLCSVKAKNLTAPRVAIMAEAAHVMSPITAQGLNLSLRDVGALFEILSKHKNLGLDLGSNVVLQDYERARRLDIVTRTSGVDFMNRIVANDHPFVKKARKKGLQALNNIPFAKNLLMRGGLA